MSIQKIGEKRVETFEFPDLCILTVSHLQSGQTIEVNGPNVSINMPLADLKKLTRALVQLVSTVCEPLPPPKPRAPKPAPPPDPENAFVEQQSEDQQVHCQRAYVSSQEAREARAKQINQAIDLTDAQPGTRKFVVSCIQRLTSEQKDLTPKQEEALAKVIAFSQQKRAAQTHA